MTATALPERQTETEPVAAPASEPARPAVAPRPMAFDERRIGATVNGLAWPIIAENLFQSALSIVDIWMISTLGAAAIAGVGAAFQIIFILSSAISAVSIGTTALIARATGAGEIGEANRIAKQSIITGLAATAGLTLAGVFVPRPVLTSMGFAPEVVDTGGEYLTILLLTSVAFVMPFVLGSALRGAGDSRTPMVATGLMNLLNVAFAWVLIFGNLGLPAMGIAGAAWAAGLARSCGAVILLWKLIEGRRPVSLAERLPGETSRWAGFRRGWQPNLPDIRRILNLGIPAAVEQVVISTGFLVFGLIIVQMGTKSVAVQQLVWNAIGLSFLPGFGFAMAATTLTGQALGARRPEMARQMTWYAVWTCGIWMSLMGLAFFFAGEWLLRPFTDDPEMIHLGAEALRVVALAQPLQPIGMVLSGGLRGAGDTRFPLITGIFTVWGVRVPIGWFAGLVLGLGLPGVYAGAVFDSGIRALLTYLRYRKGAWERIKV